ncbi:hypothetical protein HPB50_014935 [Hyalomma asiaticum]|uniref:Uncharacterized protein n=1 Tax=Hyalomma asiaticum TaxID=266040 RepID=A0ACB7SYL7_HYAAI|nr:hypothetical protein HPB50_014935 [Hyalomma asiaticum]
MSTGLDRVPRILVRMLTSVAMLLLSAVIVVCIHMYARSVAPGQEYVPVMEGELRRPDPRSMDITLAAPDTDTPPHHKNNSDKEHQACSAVHKSFCVNASRSSTAQFFYDPAEKSCLLVTVHKAHVCNRSPNQFASRQECEAACVGNESVPEPRCSERPRFVACTAADVHNPWWFHDGHRCTPWSFAGGRCPVASAPVFSAVVECNEQCGDPQKRRERGCLFPESQPCEPRQLRRPFFAVPKGAEGGGFECHEVDPELLLRHRCLLGPKGFASWEECDETCHQGRRHL